jgi:hypothetical protein
VGPRAGLDAVEERIFLSLPRTPTPRSSCQQSAAIPTVLPWVQLVDIYIVFNFGELYEQQTIKFRGLSP